MTLPYDGSDLKLMTLPRGGEGGPPERMRGNKGRERPQAPCKERPREARKCPWGATAEGGA